MHELFYSDPCFFVIIKGPPRQLPHTHSQEYHNLSHSEHTIWLSIGVKKLWVYLEPCHLLSSKLTGKAAQSTCYENFSAKL